MTDLEEIQAAYERAALFAENLRVQRDLAIVAHYAQTRDSYLTIGEMCGISHTKVRRIVLLGIHEYTFVPPNPYIDPIGLRENPNDV